MQQLMSDLPSEYAAYLLQKPLLLKRYPEGTYLAFLDGTLVGSSADLSGLHSAMQVLYPNRALMIQQLFAEEPILKAKV